MRLQSDLLTIEKSAQENHQQARTLQKQLGTISQELLSLKDTVQTLQKQEEESSSAFWEINRSTAELETPSSASSDTDSLKENRPAVTLSMGNPAYNTEDEQWRGEALRERLRQQEDHLKVQLRRRMFSQQEALSQRRLQTEGSIQGLRRRVDKLDQLLGSTSKDCSYLSDQELLPKHTNGRDRKKWSADPFELT